ncbi:hypothetical protein M3J09_009756 [Ascochyta lentis]
MASFGKVLDLLDDRYLELQDVTGNVEPLPTLVPYEEYVENVHVYRMDTNHEIFMGLIQDFTVRRAHETGKELWTWFVQWEVDNSSPTRQSSSPKKPRLDAQQALALSNTPQTPRQAPALTIFERRTLDGALMLEEEMLRILIDIVQVASALVPNFIEFLYRWIDYYEGDGKALKAALRWEIPSLWDFEYHPLVLPPDMRKESGTENGDDVQPGGQQEKRARSVNHNNTAELRQSSPTRKMHARPKPDLAAIELRTFYAEESERLQYREVKYGIQPPKLEQPLPPLINIPRDQRKRTKYYAACFKSRQRALYLLLEAGVTMRQINNYHKLQATHPKETPETGDGNGLRNYHKDAKYAQAHFELKEKQIKQREIAISNKLAAEAQFAAQTAVPDGAAGLPLIPPTPSCARRPDMAAAMVERIRETRAKKGERINFIPAPLVNRMKSKMFEHARGTWEIAPLTELLAIGGWCARRGTTEEEDAALRAGTELLASSDEEEEEEEDDDTDMESDSSNDDGDDNGDTATATSVSAPNLPHPSLPLPLPPQLSTATASTADTLDNPIVSTNGLQAPVLGLANYPTPSNIATYMQNLSSEQVGRLLPLLSAEARQAVASRLEASLQPQSSVSQATTSADGRSESESTRDLSMLEGVSGTPYSELPTIQPMQLLSDQALRRPAFAGAALDLPARPSSTTSFSVGIEQQSVQDFSLEGSQTDPLSSFGQSESEPGSEVAEPLEENTSRPLSHLQSVRNIANTAGPGREALVSASTSRSSPYQHPYPAPVTSDVPQQLRSNMLSDGPQLFYRSLFDVPGQPNPSAIGVRQYASAQGNLNVPVYALSPRSTGPGFTNPQPIHTGFNAEHFMHVRRQQQTLSSATASSDLSLPALPAATAAPATQFPLRPQPIMATDLPATNAPARIAQVLSSLPPPTPLPLQQPLTLSTPTPPIPPPTDTMLPPSRTGITRNAPTPLALSPSPFTTIAPQILATSPFLDLPSTTSPPIQIYLPRILIPGNGLGPNGTKMGNGGCVETDALLLGHEDGASGALVLSKALLLPVGVWENTLRKVQCGRWEVLETYGCPSSHVARSKDNDKGKGKEKVGTREGCHGAVYEKLAMAFALMKDSPLQAREELLTKRWRASRGPVTAFDRGAVWEGWAAYLDRGIEMSAVERVGALGRHVDEGFAREDDGDDGDGHWPYGDREEATRRRREMQELMDEDEEMDD